jgi:hypothetical protein
MPTNGKTIIKDAVAVCNYLSDAGVDTSNAIASTHSYVFDEKTPWDVIREVADVCQTSSGAVGFDGYVDPAGNLWIFARGANNSTVDLTDKIIRYKIEYDTYRVKNKIKVYGQQAKMLGDLAEALTNWTTDGTGPTQDSSDVKEGSYSIKATTPGDQSIYLNYHFTSPISCKFSHEYRKLHLWVKVDAGTFDAGAYFNIQLRTGTGLDYFRKIVEIPQKGKWMELELDIGPGSEWVQGPGADWGNINDLRIGFSNAPTSSNLTVKVDGVRFIKNFEYTAEDSTSQSLYGVRMPEPIVDDSLQSDDDCAKKAQSLLNYYKDKVTTLTITTFGNNAFHPGDMVHVVLSNDNVDGWFRILEVRHQLEDVLWQTELLLSNEPIMIDYIFRKMFEVQKTLASNK